MQGQENVYDKDGTLISTGFDEGFPEPCTALAAAEIAMLPAALSTATHVQLRVDDTWLGQVVTNASGDGFTLPGDGRKIFYEKVDVKMPQKYWVKKRFGRITTKTHGNLGAIFS